MLSAMSLHFPFFSATVDLKNNPFSCELKIHSPGWWLSIPKGDLLREPSLLWEELCVFGTDGANTVVLR